MIQSMDAIAKSVLDRTDGKRPSFIILDEQDALWFYSHIRGILTGTDIAPKDIKTLNLLGIPVLFTEPPKVFHKDFPWALKTP